MIIMILPSFMEHDQTRTLGWRVSAKLRKTLEEIATGNLSGENLAENQWNQETQWKVAIRA